MTSLKQPDPATIYLLKVNNENTRATPMEESYFQ